MSKVSKRNCTAVVRGSGSVPAAANETEGVYAMSGACNMGCDTLG